MIICDNAKSIVGVLGGLSETIDIYGSGHDDKNPRKGRYCDTDDFSSKTFDAIHPSIIKYFSFNVGCFPLK